MENTEIKSGQEWLTRDGRQVTVTEVSGLEGITYAVTCSDDNSRTLRGRYLNDDCTSSLDLVELVQAANTPTPNPQATADAIFDDAQQNTPSPSPEPVGVLGTPPSSEQRNEHIAQIIVRGMVESMDTDSIRDFINLYDSAVDGTSQPVKAA